MGNELSGGDISPFIGGPIASIVYNLLGRNQGVEEEWRLAEEQRPELEAEASRHERPE